MELQVGVKIAIVREGKVLLLKRAADKYHDIKTDRWDIVGGRINIGTPLLENLKREVLEETQMDIVGLPKLVAAQDILKSPDKHVVRLTYLGQAEGNPVLDSDHEEYKWLGAKDLENLGQSLDIYFKELLDNKTISL
jgi:ADP-ribose pyrophosphatase YjhB (NUDIX family)